MNKNDFAPVPPMGWNSYDYYDTAVNEAQTKEAADFMAEHMKEAGWEYIVVDIQWYAKDPARQRPAVQYIPFDEFAMDEYSRLLPDPERFPSSKDGAGFKPLADYIHSRGLKFGIHIMRGIPRIAAHLHRGLLGTERTAADIADPYSTCPWNPDMYGVNPDLPESQLYYDSIFALYAEWGVDFVKCDDICRSPARTSLREIPMLRKAIDRCGRPIVLSLSPGDALIEEAWRYGQNANMWRMTGDFWDNWPQLKDMFRRCEIWEKQVSRGCYPDCDMIPLGRVSELFGNGHEVNFTRDEQRTMLTLWCIFGSPLMLGGDMPRYDAETMAMLTNTDVLRMDALAGNGRQIERDDAHAVWSSFDPDTGAKYAAVFNLSDEEREMFIRPEYFGLESFEGVRMKDLWEGVSVPFAGGTFTDGKQDPERECAGAAVSVRTAPHGVRLVRAEA